MRSFLWILLGAAALFWSLFAWALHGIAGAGAIAVYKVSGWLQIEAASVQWLADVLGAAGWMAQGLVLVVWAIGMGTIAVVAFITAKAASTADAFVANAELRGAGRARPGTSVEGEVQRRSVEGEPPSGPL